MKVGAEIYCLIVNNKLLQEDSFYETEDFYSNNFLDLSLKNSLIKGLHQKIFTENSDDNNNDEGNFKSNFLLGKRIFKFLIFNFIEFCQYV